MNALYDQLVEIAQRRTIPFCYSCYRRAPTGRCSICYSDDLMVELPGTGVEYGYTWAIQQLLSEHLSPADLGAALEESIRDCYGNSVKVGWCTFDTANVIKELDPVSWRMAQSEFVDSECEAETLCTFDNGSCYYWTREIEQFIADNQMHHDLSQPHPQP